MNWLALLAGGLLGSGHCLGMCGGFVVTIGATQSRLPAAVVRQLMYAAGRIFTYGFLGAIAGLAGAKLTGWNPALASAQRWMSILAGVLMVAIGLDNLGWIPRRRSARSGGAACGAFGGSLLKHFIHAPGHTAAFLAGVFTGFLPCGLVYTFLLLALQSGGPAQGWACMTVFGLGTIPALAALGCGTTLLTHAMRLRITRVAAAFVMSLGVFTVWRGLPRKEFCCAHATSAMSEPQAPAAKTSSND